MHNTSQKSPNVEKGFTSKSEQWCRVGGVGGGLTLNFQMKIRVHTVYCQTWISKISPPTTSMIIGKRFITLYLPVFLFNPIRPIACYMLIDINDNIISYQFFFFCTDIKSYTQLWKYHKKLLYLVFAYYSTYPGHHHIIFVRSYLELA